MVVHLNRRGSHWLPPEFFVNGRLANADRGFEDEASFEFAGLMSRAMEPRESENGALDWVELRFTPRSTNAQTLPPACQAVLRWCDGIEQSVLVDLGATT